MLKSTTEPEQISSPAQTRVTPQELAVALAALEARKENAAQHLQGTIPIGDAVQELHLDATSEEIWQEVQAQRAYSPKLTKQRPRKKKRLIAFALCATILVGYAEWHTVQNMAHNTLPSQASQILIVNDTALVKDASVTPPVQETLAEVPDNHSVLCSLNLPPLGATYPPAVNPYYLDGLQSWSLIKHDGHLYLRGWTERMSDKAMQKLITDGVFYIQRASDGTTTLRPITLRVDHFKMVSAPDGADPSGFYATDVQFDKHAWEKW